MSTQEAIGENRARRRRKLAVAALAVLVAAIALAALARSESLLVHPDVSAAIENGDYDRAIALLARDAEDGDARSRTLAGLLCMCVVTNGCERSRAVSWLTPGAEAGNADAQHALARALLGGQRPESEGALSWLEKAGSSGHVLALFDLGQLEVAGRDPAAIRRGAERLQLAAEAGYAPAQFTVATLYEVGTAFAESPERAARWYRAAALQGHAVAQKRLGSLYERGLGIARDPEAADRWYRAAAETGYAGAQYALGMMYMLGEIVEPDYYEGIHWLTKAAEKGSANAQDALGRAYLEGVGVRQSPETALEWFVRAGTQGHVRAQHNAGLVYEHNFYVRNYALAAEWYQRAAVAGDGYAMIDLGDLYRFGLGVPESLSVAQGWYAAAGKSDDPEIAALARRASMSALADSVNIGLAMFGLGERFPTPGQVFDAVIGAGIGEKVLRRESGRRTDPDLQAAIQEIDRANQASRRMLQQDAMNALQFLR